MREPLSPDVPSERTRSLRVVQVDTERGWRGGQRQTLLLARELARLGHTSFVAARPGEPLAARAAAAGLRVFAIAPWTELAPRAALALRRFIQREHIDIVHAQTAHAVALAALATLGTAAHVVVTRHLARPLRDNAATRWKYGRAAAVLAVSRGAADALVASGIAADRVTVVHGGIEQDRDVVPADRVTLAALGVPAGAPIALMVGALVPQKDPLTFVRAMVRARVAVPALHAIMAGDGALRTSVEAEIAALGLRDVVHPLGFRTDVDALLAAADVAVLSSRYEGLPLAIMDAFALGVPVAATAGAGTDELVVPGDNGLLVPVGDHDALGAAIGRIVADRALHDTLAAGARRRAGEFSIERTARGTIEAYRRALGGVPAAPAISRTTPASSASSGSVTRAP